MLLLVGGPSQLETWDPKPDAPAEVRGPFGSIATRCPGVRISEHLPRMAARMDRLALVRSVHHDTAPIHETGYQLLQTGRLCRAGEEHPHFGSVVARLKGPRNGLPPFVVASRPDRQHGRRHSPRPVRRLAGFGFHWPVASASRRSGGSRTSTRSVRPRSRNGTAIDYGPDGPSARAVCWRAGWSKRACGVVTVNMFDTVFNRVTWDCHGAAPFSTLDDYASELLPTFDQAFSALIDDLERRGRLETTLVVAAGEFGRTPRLNASGGRDHWPGVWSVVLAGGGVRGGQVVGASDAHAGRTQPTAPSRPRTCWPRSITAWGSTRRSDHHPTRRRVAFGSSRTATPIRELFG